MRLKPVLSALLTAFAIVTAAAPEASASHFRYGTLNWSPTVNAGEVRFDLRVALRRDGYGAPIVGTIINETIGQTRINFGDGFTTPTLRMIVTDFSATENWIIAQALNPGTDTPGVLHTYSGAGPFAARLNNGGADACCRLGSGLLINRPDGPYPLETIVFPGSGNRSPVSNLVPIVVLPESATATFLVPASDADGDPVRWRMSTTFEAGGGPHPPNLTVDANTGVATWNNVGLEQARFWTAQIVIEDLDASGAVKTKTPVDFMLKIVPAQGGQPSCALNPPGPFVVAPGTPINFVVTGTDPDAGDTLILNGSGVPSGATMTPGLPFSGPSGVSSSFAWTPTAADEGAHIVNFSVTDSAGQQGLCSADITVFSNTAPTISCAADISLPCAGPGGTEHTLTATVQDGDGDALTVTWTVDGTVVETDNLPAGPTGNQTVTMTHTYSVGAHTVEVTVDDGQAATLARGRRRPGFASDSCTTIVTVVDNSAPVVTCTLTETMLWPPNHNMVNVGLSATSTDSCTGHSGPANVAVFGDEDDEDQTGDGRHSPDAKNIAHQTLQLRSEREGDQNGRVYLVVASAADAGGKGFACCTVTVPQNMSPASRADVLAQAAAAQAVCQVTGMPPAGYFVVGDGPILGPKQNATRFSNGTPVAAPRAVRGSSKESGKPRQRRQ